MSDTTTAATIVFNEIPYSWLVPGAYVEVRPNYTNMGIAPVPSRALIIGQMLSTGTATALTTYPLISAEQASALFGNGSQAADMAAFFLKANRFTQVDIMGVADPGSAVKAVYSLTIAGPQTAGGVLAAYLAGQQVLVPVGVADAIATIKANVIADINAVPSIPFVASSGGTGVVTLTAKHGGIIGNQLDLRTNYNVGDALPPGLTAAFAVVTPGSGAVSFTSAFAAVSTVWYTDIVLPSFDTDGSAEAELERRYNAMGKLDAYAYAGYDATYASLLTASASLSSRFRSTLGAQNPPQPPWIWAASMGGVGAFNLANDPARQLRGLVLPGILAPASADRFTDTEQNILLGDGISTYNVLNDGTVVLERAVTENKTDTNGIPTTAWQDINAPRVATAIRYDWRVYFSLNYPRNKLADDGSIAAEYDTTVCTPRRAKASWAARSLLYERQGWIEESATTAAASVFVRDANDRNRLDARQQFQRIGNMMVLAAALEFDV